LLHDTDVEQGKDFALDAVMYFNCEGSKLLLDSIAVVLIMYRELQLVFAVCSCDGVL